MSPITREVWILIGTGAGLLATGLIVGLVKGVRSWLLQWGKKSFHHEFPSKKEADQHRGIYTALIELRALTDADRSYVIRFHNGKEFLLSDPVWKATCTHEVVRPGVTYEAMNIQDILVSRISDLLEPVITGECDTQGMSMGPSCKSCPYSPECDRIAKHLVVVQVDDLPTGYTKFFLQEQNIKTIIQCTLTSRHGPFAVIGIDITSAPVTDPATLESLSVQVCQAAERIQFLFLGKDLRKANSSQKHSPPKS